MSNGFQPASETEMVVVEGGYDCDCDCPWCGGDDDPDTGTPLPVPPRNDAGDDDSGKSLNDRIGIPGFKNPPRKRIRFPFIDGGIGISIDID